MTSDPKNAVRIALGTVDIPKMLMDILYCSYEVSSDWAVFGLYLSHFAQSAYVIGVSHTCADCLGAICIGT